MMKLIQYLFFILLLGCVSCRWGDDRGENAGVPVSNIVEGVVRIKLKAEIGDGIALGEHLTKSGQTRMGVTDIDRLAAQLGASAIKPSFHCSGAFEERMRKEGFHLWYDVSFNSTYPARGVVADFSAVSEVETAELLYKVKHTAAGFNDPYFPAQWHFYNDGSIEGTTAGADINLLNAWGVTAGHPEVIVAVIDGGIDYDHPDLAANMWRNPDAQGGCGYNFVDNTRQIIPHFHGTHVAGTIAAVNNNAEGVCGIAGGSGQGDGVRLMSCQIFKPDPNDPEKDISATNLGQAFLYAANNGAVISQNSWNFVEDEKGNIPTIPQSLKQAINYFIRYAGTDAAGNQIGPMKGGIVIFAAGNENKNLCYPAAYDSVLAVAAMAPNFMKAVYSNYGSWVDVIAPGGDVTYNNPNGAVYSTYPDGKYGYLQGTSMACPHVSGIAALVVSRYGVGNPGFTPEKLKAILLKSTHDIYTHDLSYKGLLGKGYIDAAIAVKGVENAPPQRIKEMEDIYIDALKETPIEPDNYFHDPDDPHLSYSFSGFDAKMVTFKLANGKWVLTPHKTGITTITVTATDHIESITDTFRLLVRDGQQAVDLYPNPATDYIHIRMGADINGEGQVRIYDALGVNVLERTVTIRPFEVSTLNIEELSGGAYSFTLEIAGKEVKSAFVKR